MATFTPSLSERKRILKLVCNEHPRWRIWRGAYIALFILAAGLVIGCAAVLAWQRAIPEAVIAFMMTAFMLAAVPLSTGLCVRNVARYKCGLPYSSFANGTLQLGDDALEHVFWHVARNEWAAYSSRRAVYREQSKFVYRIPKDAIEDVRFHGGVCAIRGKGVTQMPTGATDDDAVQKHSDSFGFLMAFEQPGAERAIRRWLG